MNENKYFIIDFDSTFIKKEALDLLAEISLKKDPEKDKKLAEIKNLTSLAMNGKMPFSESLRKRIKLLGADKNHIEELVRKLGRNVSKSISANKEFFKNYSSQIIIISGGFKEYIAPIVSKFHIAPKQIYSNSFRFDSRGKIAGFDEKNLLAADKGKVKQLKSLGLKGEIIVVGDGYTDFELKSSGLITKFHAFTENIERSNITKEADHIAPTFDEFLYVSKMPMSISYPKNRIKVLLLEGIHPDAAAKFKEEGYSVEVISKGLSEHELTEKIKDVSILCIRSKTNVTKKVLMNAPRLLAVGAFCIGVNQVELDECSKRGVIVFNAPFSNTRSVVELAIGEIIMLMRRIVDKSAMLHKGKWDKSSAHSYEVRGKKLGIIGYGKIGAQLSILAENLGMEVYYYDTLEKLSLGNARRCATMKELLKKSDIVSVHVDGNIKNTNLIGEREFKQMKEGAVFLNLSRGIVVDINSLAENLKNGKLRGAAIDVFPEEPESNNVKFKTALQNLPNVILTPHIGGSTSEAQRNIGNFVPSKIIDFVNNGDSYYSVNFPNIQLPAFEKAHRLIHIHLNVPGILAKINSIFACHNINIIGQYLKTNEIIGYVITDISKKYSPALIKELKSVEHTIKFRVLY